MIRPLSPIAKLVIYGLLVGSWFCGIAVNTLWVSRQSAAAYWIATLLTGVPAMIAGWPLLLTPGLVLKLWGITPPEDKDHPELPPRWRFGQSFWYALIGALLVYFGTANVLTTFLSLLSGCIDPTLSWEKCP